VTCTITNDDQAANANLTIVKRIVNNNGGTKVVGDFGITTSAGALSFGAGTPDGPHTLKYTSATLSVSPGPVWLHENDVKGYTEGRWSCVGQTGPVHSYFKTAWVVVAAGESVTCTITNDDVVVRPPHCIDVPVHWFPWNGIFTRPPVNAQFHAFDWGGIKTFDVDWDEDRRVTAPVFGQGAHSSNGLGKGTGHHHHGVPICGPIAAPHPHWDWMTDM
jgi:hypothetical protein